MLSKDNRILKIGWSQGTKYANKPKDKVIEDLVARYKNEHGGPYVFVDIKPGSKWTEDEAINYLKRFNVIAVHRREYFPSHEAIIALRLYGNWCLGEYSEIDGYLPPISDTLPPTVEDQGELDI